MQDSAVLQRFQKIKSMLVSSNKDISLLLDVIESYITSGNDDELAAESIPVLDGQLSLVDVVGAGTWPRPRGMKY